MKNDKPFTKREYNIFLSLNGLVVLIGFTLLGIGDIIGNNPLKISGILLMISLIIPLKIYFKRYQGYENLNKIKRIKENTNLLTFEFKHTYEDLSNLIHLSPYFKTNELAIKHASMYRRKDIYVVVENLSTHDSEIDKIITYIDGLKNRDRGITLYYIAYMETEDVELQDKLKGYYQKFLMDNLNQVRFSDLINEDYHPSNSYFYPGIVSDLKLKTYSKHLFKFIHKKLKGEKA